MQLDFATSKPVIAEGSTEASPSPGASYFGAKKRSANVERGAEKFAKSLEKAQETGQTVGARPGDGLATAEAKHSKKAHPDLGETVKTLQEALVGLNEQQLIRALMQISPKELLHYIESLGIDAAALLTSADASPSTQAEGKGQLNRERLVRLLAGLSELLGEQMVLDAIIATAGKKRLLTPQSPEPEAGGRVKNQELGEARNVGKKPRVVVLDLRKDQAETKEGREQSSSVKSSFTLTMEKTAGAQDRDAAVLFRTPFQDKSPALEASVRTTKAASNFEQRFVPEVVKQTGIILKSGGNGEIRLVLKPENLGSVRIRLALSESSLEGRIVVDNNSVKELVESSLDNLRNALRLEGYQTNLEVSVGHRRSWSGSEQTQTQPTGWLARGSEEFDKAIPLYLEMKPDYELVNVFA